MGQTIQADETGALVVPPGLAPPLTRFTVESLGDDVLLRREPAGISTASDREAAAVKIARLREWIASLPSSPSIPLEATRRDSMYDR
jgi:hypothetical protein